MTTQEVAELLRCPVKTVEGYVHRHDLFAVQTQRKWRQAELAHRIVERLTA